MGFVGSQVVVVMVVVVGWMGWFIDWVHGGGGWRIGFVLECSSCLVWLCFVVDMDRVFCYGDGRCVFAMRSL